MVRSISAIKAGALLIATVAVASASDALAPQKEALKDVDMVSYRVDEQGEQGRELFDLSWNWNLLLFSTGWCGCAGGPGPLHHTCFDMCTGPPHKPPNWSPPPSCNCGSCTDAANYFQCIEEGGYVSSSGEWVESTSDGTASSENRSTGGAAKSSNWWMYVVGAATVALIGGAIIMRKRRNAAAEDELDTDASLSGAVNKRAALLAGGGAAAAAPGASMPKFLNVPSFRRAPSGLEVGPDGAIIEQSPSSYMDMDNHVDSSQLPDGVEVSGSGNLEPYHSGSMA